MLSIFLSFILQQLKPNNNEPQMVFILNQISNQLRNISDPVFDYDWSDEPLTEAVVGLNVSLSLILLAITLALLLKKLLWNFAWGLQTHHSPEEQARNRELRAQRLRRTGIPSLFVLRLLMIGSGGSFYVGLYFTVAPLYGPIVIMFSIVQFGMVLLLMGLGTDLLPSRKTLHVWCRRLFRWALFGEAAHDPEIVDVRISNCLFIHTPVVPKNFSIFTQLFGLQVEHSRRCITSLVPWSHLSSILPSMLLEIYSQPKLDLLPALRLCLVVSSPSQSEQPRVNKEAKRAYSTIKTSNPLQGLYLHLLLSRLYATTKAKDHWQDTCRILKCLEYSEENTSELVWLIDSIQLYTLEIKVDFTARITELLRGVVVYLAKCPGDEQNGGLLRTTTIMAAEWLISRRTSDNGNLPVQYILSQSCQSVDSNEENKVFALVNNQRLSPSERLQRIITLYQGSQKSGSSSDFVIRTLLIPIMAIESFAAEKEGKSISDAVPCIQRDDLWFSLEGLWDLWEAGFNQSDLLRFVLELFIPPSSTRVSTQRPVAVLLLNEYLQQINRSPAQITENAFRFISATLEHSLTTGTTKGGLDLQLQDFRSLGPWLSLHVDNILGRG